MKMKRKRLFRAMQSSIFTLTLLSMLVVNSYAQDPCDCAQRWTGGATWNTDGSIDDTPNAGDGIDNQDPLAGIIRCGSAAETQSNIQPFDGNGCSSTYDGGFDFTDIICIDEDDMTCGCINPAIVDMDGLADPATSFRLPEVGDDIIWIQFDVRANVQNYQFQIISNDVFCWALYYLDASDPLNVPDGQASSNPICDSDRLVYDRCGTNFANQWNNLLFETPSPMEITNFYVAAWRKSGNGKFSVNFKARFGCDVNLELPICDMASNDGPICEGGTVTLTADLSNIDDVSLYTYQWVDVTDPDPANHIVLDQGMLTEPPPQHDVTINAAGTYIYRFDVIDGEGMVVANCETTVVVNPLPDVEAGVYDPVCEDAPDIILTGSPIPGVGESGVWTGANVSDNGDGTATYDVSAGSGTATYTFTDANDCMDSDDASITVNVLPDVEAGVYDPVCEDAPDIILTGSPIPGVGESGVWTGANVSDNGDGTATYDVSAGSGTATYTFTDANDCMDSDDASITVNVLPDIEAGVYDPVCEDAPDIILTGSPIPGVGESGVWTGANVSDNGDGTATYDVSAGSGTATYTFTDANDCMDSDDASITVNVLPDVEAGVYDPVCEDAPDIILTGSPIPGVGESGVWTGANVSDNGDGTATYDVSAGSGTATYTFTDANDCMDSDDASITVNVLPDVEAGVYDPVCEDAPDIILTGSPIPGVGESGVWTGANVSDNGDGTATYDVSAGSGTATYTFTDANDCMDSDDASITVNVLPDVEAGVYDPVCEDAPDIILTGSPIPGVGESGVWTGANVSDNGDGTATYDVSAGSGTATYTFTDANDCMDSDDASITVNVLPDVEAGVYDPVCEDAPDIILTGSPIPGVGESGVWTGANVSDNGDGTATYDVSAGSGTATYTFTDANDCMDSDDASITVNVLPDIEAGVYDPVCEDAPDIILTGSPIPGVGESGVWTGANVSDNGDGTAMYDVSAGSGTATYTFTDANDCMDSDDASITVNVLPDVEAGVYDPVCEDAPDIILTGSPIPGVGESGVWTGANVSDNGDGTATYDVSAGSGTATYTFTDANDCLDSDDASITVNVLPDVEAGVYDPVCEDAPDIILTGSPIPGVGESGVWTGANVSDNGDGTATYDVSAGSGTATYTFTDANDCMDSDDASITVNVLPDVEAGVYDPVCEDAPDIILTGSPIPGVGESGVWTGANVSDNGDGTATYDVSAGSGTATYTFTDANDCLDSDDATVTVNALPLCGFDGPTIVCANTTGHIYTYSGGETNITWSIVGDANATIVSGQGTSSITVEAGDFADGNYTVKLMITDDNGCTNMCVLPVTVEDCCTDETAFAFQDGNCFRTKIKKKNGKGYIQRWGWYLDSYVDPDDPNAVEMPIPKTPGPEGFIANYDFVAGAGKCEYPEKGTRVGEVEVAVDGTELSISFNLDPGTADEWYHLNTVHVNVSCDLPTTVAPGQYNGKDYGTIMWNGDQNVVMTFDLTDPAFRAEIADCDDLIIVTHAEVDVCTKILPDAGPSNESLQINAQLEEDVQPSNELSLLAYPNPVTDHINLEVNLPLSPNAVVSLFDSFGKVVKTMDLAGKGFNRTQLEISEQIADGFYFIQVQTNEDRVIQPIVVIRN